VLSADPPSRGQLFLADISLLRSSQTFETVSVGGDAAAAAAAACEGEESASERCAWVLWAAVGTQLSSPVITDQAFRSNFDSFGFAVITVLQLLTKSQWPQVMALS
jgi:hypothetical protein